MRINASTCLPGQTIMGSPVPIPTAYAMAVATERARVAVASQAGYRLYWTAAGRFGSVDVPTEPGAFLVVGRHAFCDVVLDADPTIALRHLLVRAARLDDGCARLSVIDLHTTLGFDVGDGRCERAFAATGPVGFHVGGYTLIALPLGERLPELLPSPLCDRAAVAHPYRDAPVSRLTLLPRALAIGESAGAGSDYTLSMQSPRGYAGTQLTALDLELGVLIGRAPKCSDTLRTVLNDGISRVHLLLRKGVAYDLASTQGTFIANRSHGWQRVRWTPIEDGSQLMMGAATPVRLTFTKQS
jgi:hypothetical protein